MVGLSEYGAIAVVGRLTAVPDVSFRKSMSAVAAEACRIVSHIRAKELRDVWTRDPDEDPEDQIDEILYPGVMFTVARERMERTKLWKIVEKMPKGTARCPHAIGLCTL
jgi:adenosine deaminase CECR1